MTTTPNDAAVNAESAAKLVKSLRDTLARWSTDRAGIDDAPGSSYWAQGYNECLKQHRQTIKEILTRHATTQTQATHGEGEAKPFRYMHHLIVDDHVVGESFSKSKLHDFGRYGVDHGGKVKTIPLYTHPAPSPTAAPALGELAKALDALRVIIGADCDDYTVDDYCETAIDEVKRLRKRVANFKPNVDLASKLKERCTHARKGFAVSLLSDADCDLIEQAAAALSGVAAQGDDHV